MAEPAYFDTSERTERLQLLIHLINNTPDLLYLRGPHGAGKTRFAQQLARLIGNDFQVVWLSAAAALPLSEQLAAQVDLSQGDTQELELVLQSEDDQPLLLIVDDADGLGPADLEQLQTPARPETRILLLGTGSLVYPGNGQRVQFVDLPPFTEAQSRAFVEAQGLLGNGVDERLILSLHRAAGGQPGPLLEALSGLVAAQGRPVGRSGLSWRWGLLGAAALAVIVAGLIFQDQINQWFAPTPPQPVPEDINSESPAAKPGEQTVPAAAPGPEEPATAITRSAPATGSTVPGSPASATLPVPAPVTEQAETEQVETDSGPGDEAAPDPVLDAVIDAAISAAGGLPQEEEKTSVAETPTGVVATPAVQPAPPGEVVSKTGIEAALTPAPKAVAGPAPSPAFPPKKVFASTPPPRPASPGERPAAKTTAKTGLAWLLAQPGTRYTLQLVGGRDPASIQQFIHQYKIKGPYAVFARDLDGRPWYSLVSGSYPDRKAALAGLAGLPKGLNGAWPRTFASIQGLLHNSGTPASNQ